MMTAASAVQMVATGSDLKGGGVFSFIKAKGSPKNRAITGGVLAALTILIFDPQLVSAMMVDGSVNTN